MKPTDLSEIQDIHATTPHPRFFRAAGQTGRWCILRSRANLAACEMACNAINEPIISLAEIKGDQAVMLHLAGAAIISDIAED